MIELTELTRTYRSRNPFSSRKVEALRGVSMSITPGESIGIVGLNGAGKSTLLRLLLGYLRPTAGSLSIDGRQPRDYVEAEGIAYVPEKVAIPRGWTVLNSLRTYAMLANLGEGAWDEVDRALDRLGLGPMTNRKVGDLSKGNLQRLAIAQALLGNRRLMILDEPTDGLDPIWIAGLREIVTEWQAADPDRIVLIASHNLPEIYRLTGRKILLHDGELVGEIDAATSEGFEQEFLARVGELEGVAA